MSENEIFILYNGQKEVFDIEDVTDENLKDYFGFEVKFLIEEETGKIVFIRNHEKFKLGSAYKLRTALPSLAEVNQKQKIKSRKSKTENQKHSEDEQN